MRVMRINGLARPSWRRAMAAGMVGGTGYLGEMAIDMRLTRNRYDDLLLWGGLLPVSLRKQRALGLLAHFTFGTLLCAVYASLRPRLPRLPGWLLGILFTQVESAALFPGIVVLERLNRASRRGDLPPLWRWEYFLLEVVRHVPFGIVMGIVSSEVEE